MEKEFSLIELWRVLKKYWLSLVLVALAVMLVVGCCVYFLIPKKYAASVQFHVINRNPNATYTQSALEGVKEYLAKDYIATIQGDDICRKISEVLKENGYELSPSRIRSMMQASTDETSSQFTMQITTTDPEISNLIIGAIRDYAPVMIPEITKNHADISVTAIASSETELETVRSILKTYGDKLNLSSYSKSNYSLSVTTADSTVADAFKKDLEQVSDKIVVAMSEKNDCVVPLRVTPAHQVGPNILKYVVIGGLAALLGLYVILLIYNLLSCSIHNEHDAKTMLDAPVLGVIPKWDAKDEYGYRKNAKEEK